MDGYRDSKTVNGVTHSYETLNGQVVRETWTENGIAHVLDILTDNNSRLYALVYDGTTYYYVLNQQGDVIRLVDSNGATYANYSYNAWGEPVRVYLDNGSEITAADHIANLNPIRYRGYYYDTETGFYYLQSRYYDPVLCRFVNADSQLDSDSFLGYNLFAYCANNPVNNSDPDGHGFWKSVVKRVKKAVKKVVKATKRVAKRIIRSIIRSKAFRKITYFHFEGRAAFNSNLPTYEQASSSSEWTKLPQNQSIYHDNGIGKHEKKYIHPDGREVVFDGDTNMIITAPEYIGTYNYGPIYSLPDYSYPDDYARRGLSYIKHGVLDVLPYYLTFKSNTRSQFEDKVLGIFD